MRLAPNRDLVTPPVVVPKGEYRVAHGTPTKDQVQALLAATDGWFQALLALLACTGCRIGEVSSLRWDQVDANGQLTVTGKTGPRTIPLSGDALALLRALRPAGETVWGVPPETIEGAVHGTKMQRACKRAGIPYFSGHALRRYVEDALAEAGVDIAVYAAFLGHTPEVALKHYRRVRPQALQKAACTAQLGHLDMSRVLTLAS